MLDFIDIFSIFIGRYKSPATALAVLDVELQTQAVLPLLYRVGSNVVAARSDWKNFANNVD